MKKIFFALAVLSLLACPAPAQAEEGAKPATTSGDSSAKRARPERPKKTFEERKAAAVAKAQKRLACVQAAQNAEALRACSPRHRGGHSGGKMRGKRGGGEGTSPAPAQ